MCAANEICGEYARTLIRVKAKQLVRQPGFKRSEQRDIEQDLMVHLLAQADRFDPTRSSIDTFVDRVVDSGAGMLVRARKRLKRCPEEGIEIKSLAVVVEQVDEPPSLWGGRVLVLAHVKELLEQNADKIRQLCPDLPVGIYSAGLKRRDTDTPVLVAGIQSVYKRACELDPFDLVVIDECHLLTKDGEGTYRRFLKDCLVINPQMRVIGLTATPFRLDSGLVCTPDHFINYVCYEAGIREMIRDGYSFWNRPYARGDFFGL